MAKVLAGISFPFRKEGIGIPAPAYGRDAIRSCLIVLLKTPRRSRVMRPDVGIDLNEMIFEDVGPMTIEIIRDQIRRAVSEQLPQVRIVDLIMETQDKKITVNLRYIVQGVLDETGAVELKV